MVVTLTGPNSYALKAEGNRLITAFLAAHDAMGLERIEADEADFDRIREALEAMPFLSDKKLVVLRAPGANKQFAEAAERLLGNIPDTTDVVLVEPKLDKRLTYYKTLKKTTDLREYAELDANGLTRWLVDEAKRQNGTLSSGDARFLVERSGAGQEGLARELDKLLAYDATITRTTIGLLVEPTPQSTLFELLEAAFAGNTVRAFALYDEQRAQRVEPPQIIAMLAWQLHVLALLKTAGERSLDTIAREAKISPYVVKKTQGLARRLSLTRLKNLVAALLLIDRRGKRISLDMDEALRNYLLAITVSDA